MREPPPGFEHESEKLERAAIKEARDKEINWTPPGLSDEELALRLALHTAKVCRLVTDAIEKDIVRMKWTDITSTGETK